MTIEQVRKELRDVKLYYSRKELVEGACEDEFIRRIKANVQKYDLLILKASDNLYKVYKAMYLQGKNQEKSADELSYSVRNVQRLHNELLLFFANNL